LRAITGLLLFRAQSAAADGTPTPTRWLESTRVERHFHSVWQHWQSGHLPDRSRTRLSSTSNHF
jgi:hypothetical protein